MDLHGLETSQKLNPMNLHELGPNFRIGIQPSQKGNPIGFLGFYKWFKSQG
jgi:hypothetical protein